MILIIAEKPSLARNIMAGIDEKFNKCDGFYAGETYLVSWAVGHLFSLADIETYTGSENKKWTLEGLPCYPEKFKFEIRKNAETKKEDYGIRKQFLIDENEKSKQATTTPHCRIKCSGCGTNKLNGGKCDAMCQNMV